MFQYESRKDIVARAREILAKMHSDLCKVGTKRQWNSTFRISIPSKNDIKRDAVANLESLNDICTFEGWDGVYDGDDEEEVKIGKVKAK